MANQVVTLKAAGLQTYFQSLLEIPPGSLLVAVNTVINKEGVIEPRRGIKYYGSILSNKTKQLMEYKGRILRHVDDKVSYDDGTGNFTNFTGSFYEVAAGVRLKYLETKSNLYFTTSDGVKKLSATSASDFSLPDIVQDCGAPKSVTGTVKINYSTIGFLPANNKVAYRITWGYTDRNENLLEGAPCARMVAYNQSPTNNTSVDITFQIPYNVDTSNYFFRIYRSEYGTIEPSDEMNLVFEGNPTSAELSSRIIVFNDFLDDTIRNAGLPLYTNKYSGQGILNANEAPPAAKDIALYKGHMFYANTRSKHFTEFNLLSTTGFTSGVSDLVITDGTTSNTYTFVGAKEKSDVTCLSKSLTTNQSFFLLSSASNERNYFVWFDKTGSSSAPSTAQTVGRIGLKVDISSDSTADQVADRLKVTLNASLSYDFVATRSLHVVTIENVNNGNATNTTDSTDTPTNYTFSTITQGDGEDTALRHVLLSNNASVSQSIEQTAKSLVDIINKQSGEIVNAYYLSTTDDVPGKILLQKKTLADTPFYVATTDSNITLKFSPEIGRQLNNTVAISNPVTITTSSNHNLSVNNYVFIYGATTGDSINGYQKVINVPAVNQYKIDKNVTTVTVNGYTIIPKIKSNNDYVGNRLYYSKYLQPEAVPLLFYIDIGARDQEIHRIIALRESLFILKGDGVYRLTGDPGVNPSFSINVFDNTSIIKAPDTAVTLGNQCYYFGNQGLVRLNESSVESISRPIEDKLIPFLTTNSNISTASFCQAYESDRSLLLFTVKTKSDTVATICYRYNTYTGTWTEWDISKTCSVLNRQQDKLYFGSGSANTVEVERKNFNRFDYADREITLNLPTLSISGTTLKPSSLTNIDLEDVVYQTQYLTIYQYNMLLKRLDMDNGISPKNFYSTLKMEQGDNLTNKMNLLVAKLNVVDTNPFLDTNGNTSYVFSGSTNFETIQTEYNKIIDRLNQSPTTILKEYKQSENTTAYEAIVTEIDTIKKTITVHASIPLIVGDFTLYKGIKTDIQYAPQHAGDPASFKQFSTGTFMFERRSFYTAQASYNSDISDDFEEISFTPNSAGTFGNFTWGEGSVFGGQGDQAQIRTYIPRKKQRCRFLGCRFKHGVALENYELYGLAISVRGYSIPDRDYK